MKTHPWYVINAGGSPRSVAVGCVWLVPMFKTHDECNKWWHEHCRKTGDQQPWGVTDQPNNWPEDK